MALPRMTRDEHRNRARELEAWQRQFSGDVGDQRFTPEQREEWNAADAELAEHRLALNEMAARDAVVRRAAEQPSSVEQAGRELHAARPTEDDHSPFVRVAHTAGLRTIERFAKADVLTARGADNLDRMVREGDVLGLGSRYLEAVGDPNYESAFGKILRDPMTAHYRFSPEETAAVQRVTRVEQERALVEGTGSAGGFAVPFVLDPTIIHTDSSAINPLRDLARVIPIGTNQWKGVSADAPTATYATEATAVSDNSPTLVQPTIFVATGRAFVPASFEVWQDWEGIVHELANLLQQSRDKLDATQMLTGTGATGAGGAPGGVLNIGGTGGLTTAQRVQTAVSATFAIGDVYTFKQVLAATVFAANATWVAHPTTYDKILRFVGGGNTTEPPLYADFDRAGPLLGYPKREMSTLVTTTTTGSRIMILGDWSGFQIIDRVGSQIEIIPNLFGAAQGNLPTGQRGLFYWWRTGTGVIAANKLRYLEVL